MERGGDRGESYRGCSPLTLADCRPSSWSSLHNTGYRDVMINIRIVRERARELGVDSHVFELQLLLIDHARIKSEAGHARYIEWRNTRGE
eukprot:767561-Hanusia_phi.AAC.11